MIDYSKCIGYEILQGKNYDGTDYKGYLDKVAVDTEFDTVWLYSTNGQHCPASRVDFVEHTTKTIVLF